MAENMRPGVSSSYTITPVNPQNKGRGIGLIANSSIGSNEVMEITSFEQAKILVGNKNENLLQMISVIYEVTSPTLYLIGVAVNSDAEFTKSLDKIMKKEDVYIILPQQINRNRCSILKETLQKSVGLKAEKIGVVTSIQGEAHIDTAKYINCERIFLTYPKIAKKGSSQDLSASILCGFISRNQDLSSNLNGEYIDGEFEIGNVMTEDEINIAISQGVCVFEQVKNYTELIRGVTTKTMNASGGIDTTYRNLSTVVMIDSIVPMIRKIVEQRLKFLKNSPASINSIISLIVCELSNFKDEGLIASYETPLVAVSEDDRSVLIIDLIFTVAQGINQVKIECHINV